MTIMLVPVPQLWLDPRWCCQPIILPLPLKKRIQSPHLLFFHGWGGGGGKFGCHPVGLSGHLSSLTKSQSIVWQLHCAAICWNMEYKWMRLKEVEHNDISLELEYCTNRK